MSLKRRLRRRLAELQNYALGELDMADTFHDPNLDHAANDIRWLGERLKGLIGAAEALKNLGSINNAINEKTAIHDELVKQIADRNDELTDLQGQIAAAKTDHEEASTRLAEVRDAHRRATELLGGVLKQMAPQG